MSALDDFNRIAYERADHKYRRARYDDLTTDDWVALVEGERARVSELENEREEIKGTCACGACD